MTKQELYSKAAIYALGIAVLVTPLVSLAQTSTTAPAILACPTFTRSLWIGESGSDVTALQQFLATRGYLSVSATGYFGPLTQTAVEKWQLQNSVTASSNAGFGIFGPLSRATLARSCGSSTGTQGVTTSANIQQLNAPGTVQVPLNGIAEIRNDNFYFTLQSLSNSSATIQITPVGCWNSFPSDPKPKIICMLAMLPIPPQTLSVGQSYTATNYSVTLTSIQNDTATFSVN